MTGIVFVPSFCVVATLLLLNVVWQLANDSPQRHAQPRWVPQPTRHIHPSWRGYTPQALSQAAQEASRQIALARYELATADRLAVHFDWSALTPAIGQRVPIEHLPARQPRELTPV